jgi:hypothetical protein
MMRLRWLALLALACTAGCSRILGIGGVHEADDANTAPADAKVDAPEGAIDAQPDAPIDARADGGTVVTSSLIVPASNGGKIFVLDPMNLSMVTVPVSNATAGLSNPVADNGTVWAFDINTAWAFDAGTLSLLPKYPITLRANAVGCFGNGAFESGGRVYCVNPGAQGTSDDTVEVWQGSPIAQTGARQYLPSARTVTGSATRVLVTYGYNKLLAVYDSTFTAVPGSPLDVPEGSDLDGVTAEVNDDMGVIAAGTVKGLRAWHRSTLQPIGPGSVALPAQVDGIAFEPPSTIVVALANGTVARVSATDLKILTDPVSVSSSATFAPYFDATMGRLYVLADTVLYSLDPTTLKTLGSKTLPTYASGIVAR